jgi:hypothetical protein
MLQTVVESDDELDETTLEAVNRSSCDNCDMKIDEQAVPSVQTMSYGL